jgi:hypothetical protein
MLKKSASSVLASFRPSTYPRGYASGPSLAAALLDSLFEHPAWRLSRCATRDACAYLPASLQAGLHADMRTIEALACRNSFAQAVSALFRHRIVDMTVAKP